MRKTFLLLLLIFPFPLFWACEEGKFEDPCAGLKPCIEGIPYFKIGGLELSQVDSTFENYLIYVSLKPDFFSFLHQGQQVNGKLMACSPAPCPEDGHKGAKVGLASFNIFTVNEYRPTMPAGGNMNVLFDVYTSTLDTWEGRKESVTSYIARNDSIIYEHALVLQLNSPPKEEAEQAFRIVYTLDDGRRFEAQTEPILLKP